MSLNGQCGVSPTILRAAPRNVHLAGATLTKFHARERKTPRRGRGVSITRESRKSLIAPGLPWPERSAGAGARVRRGRLGGGLAGAGVGAAPPVSPDDAPPDSAGVAGASAGAGVVCVPAGVAGRRRHRSQEVPAVWSGSRRGRRLGRRRRGLQPAASRWRRAVSPACLPARWGPRRSAPGSAAAAAPGLSARVRR